MVFLFYRLEMCHFCRVTVLRKIRLCKCLPRNSPVSGLLLYNHRNINVHVQHIVCVTHTPLHSKILGSHHSHGMIHRKAFPALAHICLYNDR